MSPDPLLERRPDMGALRLHGVLRGAGVGHHAQDWNLCPEPLCVAAKAAVLAWYRTRPKAQEPPSP